MCYNANKLSSSVKELIGKLKMWNIKAWKELLIFKNLGLQGVSVGLKDCSVRLYSKKIIRNGNNNNNNDKKSGS